MTGLRVLLGLGLAASLASCASGPVAGDLTFTLHTPNADDGAIAFRVATSAPQTIGGGTALCTGCRIFLVSVADTEVSGIVTGPLRSGAIFSLTVSDTRTPSAYTGTVLDAASGTFVERGPAGYHITASQDP
ncbi:MAG TPA: hypothetical protein VJ992_04135 [Gemmatimonadales bacterium]|nr:hypothetical protein [Gemmatimonadales bacterium]